MTSSKKRLQVHILEPILTPSGLFDGGEDTPDPTSLDIDLIDDFDNGDIEDLTSIADVPIEELETIDFINELDLSSTFESGYFTVGETGEVSVDFLRWRWL